MELVAIPAAAAFLAFCFWMAAREEEETTVWVEERSTDWEFPDRHWEGR